MRIHNGPVCIAQFVVLYVCFCINICVFVETMHMYRYMHSQWTHIHCSNCSCIFVFVYQYLCIDICLFLETMRVYKYMHSQWTRIHCSDGSSWETPKALYYNHLLTAYLTFASPSVCICLCVCICITIICSLLYAWWLDIMFLIFKLRARDSFRGIDLSGRRDPVAKWDDEQWCSITFRAKRNTLEKYLQEIQLQRDDEQWCSITICSKPYMGSLSLIWLWPPPWQCLR